MLTVLERILLAVAIAANIAISHWIGQLAFTWMPAQATAEAERVDDLFSFLVSIGAFVFLSILGIIVYSVIFFRASRDNWEHGHPARSDWRIEALWTIVPVCLVLWIAVQSYQIYQQLNILGLSPIVHLHAPDGMEPAVAAEKPSVNNDAKPSTNTIDVVARQWSWSFRYLGNVTSTELHLPVNQTTQLQLRSDDVLHGFFVPEFRVKQDIIPNRTITFAFTPLRAGQYLLHDSQFSGAYFALMDTNVYVESAADYQQWLTQAAKRQPTPSFNRAVLEHAQPSANAFGSGWAVVPPAPPPVVNAPSKEGQTP